MRPIVPAAVAACLAFIPAPAAAAFIGIWLDAPDYSSGGQGLLTLTSELQNGEIRDIGLPDIKTLQLVATFRDIPPTGAPLGASAIFTLADIETFSARVVGAFGGAHPIQFQMTTKLKPWTPGTPAAFIPETRIVMNDRTYSFITDKGATISTGRLLLSVPEPAAWISMLAGLFMLGAIMRQHRHGFRQPANFPTRHI